MNENKIWILAVEARHQGETLEYEGFYVCESKLAAQQEMQRQIHRISRENNCFTNGRGLIGEGFNVERTDDHFDCWSPNTVSTYARMVIEERPIIAEGAVVIDEETACDPEVREALNTAWSMESLRRDWGNILYAIAVRDDADFLTDEVMQASDATEAIMGYAPEILNKMCDENDLRMVATFLRLV